MKINIQKLAEVERQYRSSKFIQEIGLESVTLYTIKRMVEVILETPNVSRAGTGIEGLNYNFIISTETLKNLGILEEESSGISNSKGPTIG